MKTNRRWLILPKCSFGLGIKRKYKFESVQMDIIDDVPKVKEGHNC